MLFSLKSGLSPRRGSIRALPLFGGLAVRRPQPSALGKRVKRPEKILVTGGAGYIGTMLVPLLLRCGRRVRVFDRLDFGCAGLQAAAREGDLETMGGDIRDARAVAKALRDVDAVIHLAAIVGDPACADERLEAREINADGAKIVAEIAARMRVARMLLASTCSVYGSNPELVDEESALNPVSLYARTKIAAEQAVLALSSADFCVTALRIGTAFGWSRRPRFDLFVNLLTAKARFDNRAVIFNGERWRPFVHVEDIARGFVAALDAPPETVAGRTLNLGSNSENRRLSDVARTLQELNPHAEIVEESNTDPRDYRVRFDKIERLLGFRAVKSLGGGILEMDAMLARGLIRDYRDPIYHNHRLGELERGRPSASEQLRNGLVGSGFPAPERIPFA